jgi:acetylornithine/N-succinyldiaminopimelate aminotransferase
VQCGIGRTGKFFAFEYAGITPDIVPIAKGIGGGFPIGACLMTKKVASCMGPGSHGSTFAGNPLAMSAGNAVLDEILKKGFLKNVQTISRHFHTELNKLQSEFPNIIKEVRGLGLLTGIKITPDQNIFIKKLLKNKLLTIRAAENVVRLLPPLNVKKENINEAIVILRKVCKNFK